MAIDDSDESPRQLLPNDDAAARRLRKAQKDGAWDVIEAFFSGLQHSSDRVFYTDALSEWIKRPDFIDRWVVEDPESTTARLVRGAHSIKWAWEIRTGSRAKDVNPRVWPIFRRRLESAVEDLEYVAKTDRKDAVALGYLLWAALGLGLDKNVAAAHFREAKRRDPECYLPHLQMGFLLLQKWGGSHEKLFDFVRNATARARLGSEVHVLVPFAHLERWTYAMWFDNDQAFADRYWKRKDVRAEIVAAHDSWLGDGKCNVTKMTPEIRNYFALSLYLSNQKSRAKREFEELGNTFTRLPWALTFQDPISMFSSCCIDLGVSGSSHSGESQHRFEATEGEYEDYQSPVPIRNASRSSANRSRSRDARKSRPRRQRPVAPIIVGIVATIVFCLVLWIPFRLVNPAPGFGSDSALRAELTSEINLDSVSIRLSPDFSFLMRGSSPDSSFDRAWRNLIDPHRAVVQLSKRNGPQFKLGMSVLNPQTLEVIERAVTGEDDGALLVGDKFAEKPLFSSGRISGRIFECVHWKAADGRFWVAYVCIQDGVKYTVRASTAASFETPDFRLLEQIALSLRIE